MTTIRKNIILALCLLAVLCAGCADRKVSPTQPPAETETQVPTTEAVMYTVTVEGGGEPMILTGDAVRVSLTHAAQVQSLADQAALLPLVTEITFAGETPRAAEILRLQEAFPGAEIAYSAVTILGTDYPRETAEIHLPALTGDQVPELALALPLLPELTDVYLTDGEGNCTVALADAGALCEACPELKYHYFTELFGQRLSTDMETVEYFKTPIGDEGLEQFQLLLPMMYNLNYLRLDWCQTSDEAMAQLRDEYANRFPVVWRVFMGQYNCLTDTYKVWANGLTTEEASVLKYCTEVRYMDIGHSVKLENIDFCAYMPKLEALIIADCQQLTSIEPLRNCTNLEYLEVFTTGVSDLSPLAGLTSLEHLNISRMPAVTDLSPLNGLVNLKRLWSNRNDHIEDQVLAFQEANPECEILTRGGHPVNYQWRFTSSAKTHKVPRYALLKKQMGYETADKSCYPKGYVREEITYESTGITP